MKTIRNFAAIGSLIILSVVVAHAFTVKLPHIPTSKLSASEAIGKLDDYLKANFKDGDSGMVLIAVEWCRGDNFQPRLSDGTQWHVTEGKQEWSWFFTYAVHGKTSKTFSDIRVMQIRDSGEVNSVGGNRT